MRTTFPKNKHSSEKGTATVEEIEDDDIEKTEAALDSHEEEEDLTETRASVANFLTASLKS